MKRHLVVELRLGQQDALNVWRQGVAAAQGTVNDGVTFAGSHLILDLWDAHDLDDEARIEKALKDAVTAAGATLLHIHLHKFEPNGGVSGVAVLSESHISVHTWPEKGFAAFDVFMCGAAQPTKTIAVLEAAFRPKRVVVGEHKRGIV